MKHKQAKPEQGVQISDGGRGHYPADIIEVGDCFVVVGNLDRGGMVYDDRATHAIMELPGRVYQDKKRGISVVPKAQLIDLRGMK